MFIAGANSYPISRNCDVGRDKIASESLAPSLIFAGRYTPAFSQLLRRCAEVVTYVSVEMTQERERANLYRLCYQSPLPLV
jgi:hypothetical protein